MSTPAVDSYGAGYTAGPDADPVWAQGTMFDSEVNTSPSTPEGEIATDTLQIAQDYANEDVSNRERLVRAILGDAVDTMTLDSLLAIETIIQNALNEGLAAGGAKAPEFHLVDDDMSFADALPEDVEGAFISPEQSGTSGGVILLSRDLLDDPERLGEVALEELGEALAHFVQNEGILQERGLEIEQGDVGERISSTIQEERIEEDTWETSDSDTTDVNWGGVVIENVAASNDIFAADIQATIDLFDNKDDVGNGDGVITMAEVRAKVGNPNSATVDDRLSGDPVNLFTAAMRLYSGGDGKLSESDLETAFADGFLGTEHYTTPTLGTSLRGYEEGDLPRERFTALISAMSDGGLTSDEFVDVMGYMVQANMLTSESREVIESIYDSASVSNQAAGIEGLPDAEALVAAIPGTFRFSELRDDESINIDTLLNSMFPDGPPEKLTVDDFPEGIKPEVYTMFQLFAADPGSGEITHGELQSATNRGLLSWVLNTDGPGGEIFVSLPVARGQTIANALESDLGVGAIDNHSFARAFGTLFDGGFRGLNDGSKNAVNALFDKAQMIANGGTEGQSADVRFDDIETALNDNEIILARYEDQVEVFVDQVPNPPSGWPPLDAVRDVATPVLNDWETYTANGWIFGIFDDLV